MVYDNLNVENAQILFKNFSGIERQYNEAGDRNFSVLFDEPTATRLKADGWNIKPLRAQNEGDEPMFHLPVAVNYNNIPPEVWMITTQRKVLLNEASVGILDNAEITQADLVIRPYNWERNGLVGVKAYIKTGYITILEDKFASKYSDVPSDMSGDTAF